MLLLVRSGKCDLIVASDSDMIASMLLLDLVGFVAMLLLVMMLVL